MITLVLYIWFLPNLTTWLPCGRERILFILGSLGQRSRSLLLYIKFLISGSFPHDNFSSVYWISNKLGHMIFLWKGNNPIYFVVITITSFDNLYRRAYFVMHTFLVNNILNIFYSVWLVILVLHSSIISVVSLWNVDWLTREK